MNKIKNFFSKAQNKANELVISAKTALQNKSGEGYIDTAVKIIIGVVIGSLILVGLYALFNGVVIPNLNTEIGDKFDARSVAYILTKRYGVDASIVSIESIPDNLGDYEPDEFKGKIAEILDVARKIDGRISEVLDRPIEKKKETVKTSESEEKATPRKSKEGNER